MAAYGRRLIWTSMSRPFSKSITQAHLASTLTGPTGVSAGVVSSGSGTVSLEGTGVFWAWRFLAVAGCAIKRAAAAAELPKENVEWARDFLSNQEAWITDATFLGTTLSVVGFLYREEWPVNNLPCGIDAVSGIPRDKGLAACRNTRSDMILVERSKNNVIINGIYMVLNVGLR